MQDGCLGWLGSVFRWLLPARFESRMQSTPPEDRVNSHQSTFGLTRKFQTRKSEMGILKISQLIPALRHPRPTIISCEKMMITVPISDNAKGLEKLKKEKVMIIPIYVIHHLTAPAGHFA